MQDVIVILNFCHGHSFSIYCLKSIWNHAVLLKYRVTFMVKGNFYILIFEVWINKFGSENSNTLYFYTLKMFVHYTFSYIKIILNMYKYVLARLTIHAKETQN